MLKNIINERDSELDSMSTASSVSSAPNTLPRRAHTRVYTEPNLAAYSGRPPVTPRTTPHRPAKPMMNTRYHRRSRSADIWLEHRPEGTVETAKDTQKSSKYVLTHQEVDSDGAVTTSLVKGSMVPTAGGGTSVVFNDVETLQQISPGDRKRKSESLRPEDFDGEWTDVETRCKIGIEGHGIPK
ncbi:hypothetical protein NP493_48g04029 [Ridgeia piscesae]|uniref:Kinesin-like protein Kif23 Arf6-interacting domain-containing protein n=1 Tax=Ridgeia piscesae TaxID=27915 RepID=A0AAD9UJM1_RIDPI|nr:hypothetical protein NP493_48g04029 [Ridgeia piscesae]